MRKVKLATGANLSMKTSLRYLFAIVGYAAFVFATFVSPNGMWESVAHVVAIASVAIATVAAIHRRSTILASYTVFFLAGFAICNSSTFTPILELLESRFEEDYYTVADIAFDHSCVLIGFVGMTVTAILIKPRFSDLA